MTYAASLGMKAATCPVCGKRFEFFTSYQWAYNIGYKKQRRLVCSWHCLREHERKSHMGYPLLTGELKEKIRGMIAQGMKPGRIIDETGASRSTIYRLAKEIGAPEYEEPEAAPPAPGKIAVRVRRTWETENVSVFEDDGRIEIELTTTENDTVESLRSYGEQLLAIAEEIERGKDH